MPPAPLPVPSSHETRVRLDLTFRDLEPEDLADLDWSGGSEHVTAVGQAWQAAAAGAVELLVVALPSGRLVGLGGVDFRPDPASGVLWMLSVHETLQGTGIGTALVGALEARVLARGRRVARLSVEQDNPRAAALYRRLGYREVGTALESWPTTGGRTYVTVSAVLQHDLGRASDRVGERGRPPGRPIH